MANEYGSGGYSDPGFLALTGIAVGLEVGAILSIPLMWDSYWWLFLTGGLVVLGVLVSGWWKYVGHAGRVATLVLASVAVFWVAFALIRVEALDEPAPSLGGPVGVVSSSIL
jgi:hypothetical protein